MQLTKKRVSASNLTQTTHHVPLWEEEVGANVLKEMSKAFL